MALYKRAKGRSMAYAQLKGHDTFKPDHKRGKKPTFTFNGEREDLADPIHHGKGLQRVSLRYARKIAKIRKDDFYNGIVCLKGA